MVSMSAAAPGVRLLARSVDEYLHRVLATEDVLGGDQPLAAAAGHMGRVLYEVRVYASQSSLPVCLCPLHPIFLVSTYSN